MFYRIPNIRELLAIRQCRFIGKVVRGPNENNYNYGDLSRWIDIAIDKQLWDYKISKLKILG